MKKYFAIFALVFASVISVYGQHKQAADSGAVIVDMNKQTIGMPTMSFSVPCGREPSWASRRR